METAEDVSTVDYNWDNLSVGNLHASQASTSFFVHKHVEHEQFYITRQKAEALENAQNIPQKQENIDEFLNNENQIKIDEENNVAAVLEQLTMEQPQPLKPIQPPNLNTQPESALHAVKSEVSEQKKKEFNVVRFARIYDLKKKCKREAIEKQEREQRKFHSKPAPDFNAIHAATERKRQQQSPKITCPSTPSVLKRHREAQERLQKKKEEYEASLRRKPFVSHSPDVLKHKPFIPHIEKIQITAIPFNLKSDERLKERKQFDENIRLEAERKQHEKEEKRRIEEENIRRELRKQTIFKAQPNPFK